MSGTYTTDKGLIPSIFKEFLKREKGPKSTEEWEKDRNRKFTYKHRHGIETYEKIFKQLIIKDTQVRTTPLLTYQISSSFKG